MTQSIGNASYTNVIVKNTFLVIGDDDPDDNRYSSRVLRMRSCPPIMCRHNTQVDASSEGDEDPRYCSYEALMPVYSNLQDSPTNQNEYAGWDRAAVHDNRDDVVPYADHDEEITTMMIRNIPCRCSKDCILQDINRMGFEGTYDFFYLPLDRRRKSNLGYAFINFRCAEAATHFQMMLSGYKFSTNSRISNSQKVCCVSPAAIQGFENNWRHFTRESTTSKLSMDQLWTGDGDEINEDLSTTKNTGSIDGGSPSHLVGTRFWL